MEAGASQAFGHRLAETRRVVAVQQQARAHTSAIGASLRPPSAFPRPQELAVLKLGTEATACDVAAARERSSAAAMELLETKAAHASAQLASAKSRLTLDALRARSTQHLPSFSEQVRSARSSDAQPA